MLVKSTKTVQWLTVHWKQSFQMSWWLNKICRTWVGTNMTRHIRHKMKSEQPTWQAEVVFTIRLGQGLGSCNVSVSTRTHNVSSRSRTKCPMSWSRTYVSRVSSRPERSHVNPCKIHGSPGGWGSCLRCYHGNGLTFLPCNARSASAVLLLKVVRPSVCLWRWDTVGI